LDKPAAQLQALSVTILMNKPVGYVSGQAEDGYTPAVALIKPESRWAQDKSEQRFVRQHLRGLAVAGRLDIDSTGLLVLTQDGRIARKLIGEDHVVDKEYLVRVAGRLDERGLALLNHGLSLDGKALKPAKVSWQNQDQLNFVLNEGKKPPDSPDVRACGPEGCWAQARQNRTSQARRLATWAVALSRNG